MKPNDHIMESSNEGQWPRHEAFMDGMKNAMNQVRSGAKFIFRTDPKIGADEILKRLSGMLTLRHRFLEPGEHGQTAFMTGPDYVAILDVSTSKVIIQVVSEDLEAQKKLDAIIGKLKGMEFVQTDPDGVWADFSYKDDDGPRTSSQFLKCPSWESIQSNYPEETRQRIRWLIDLEDPTKMGRMAIWHGPPGTGKTYAIRALMMAWRNRYRFVVVTDPERLAREPAYYYSVADNGRDDEYDEEGKIITKGKKRTLFIMEDAADLVLQQSRATHYDKMSRLLNITDGLFGQGRQDLFLFTFNEKVEEIDPAFLRPGRCVMNQEFKLFSPKEATLWLADHQEKGKAVLRVPSWKSDVSLAQLYAELLGIQEVPSSAKREIHYLGK